MAIDAGKTERGLERVVEQGIAGAVGKISENNGVRVGELGLTVKIEVSTERLQAA